MVIVAAGLSRYTSLIRCQALQLTNCVNLKELLHVSLPQFP